MFHLASQVVSEYKSAIACVFSVSYLINVTCGLQMAEDQGTTCFLTCFIFLMLISRGYIMENQKS